MVWKILEIKKILELEVIKIDILHVTFAKRQAIWKKIVDRKEKHIVNTARNLGILSKTAATNNKHQANFTEEYEREQQVVYVTQVSCHEEMKNDIHTKRVTSTRFIKDVLLASSFKENIPEVLAKWRRKATPFTLKGKHMIQVKWDTAYFELPYHGKFRQQNPETQMNRLFPTVLKRKRCLFPCIKR